MRANIKGLLHFSLITISVSIFAAEDEESIKKLATLDAREYCLSTQYHCQYSISRIPESRRLETSPTVWAALVSRSLVTAGWDFYPPGDTPLQIAYDENGKVTSKNKDTLPLRTSDTLHVNFLHWCREALSRGNALPNTDSQSSKVSDTCVCALDKLKGDDAVRKFFTTPLDQRTDEMNAEAFQARVAGRTTQTIRSCQSGKSLISTQATAADP
jgi:hypothetical protein